MLVKEFLLKKNPGQLNPRKTCTGWKKKIKKNKVQEGLGSQ